MPSPKSKDSFGAKSTLDVGGKSYEIFRLDAVTGDGLDVESLPYSLKVLLENLLRTEDGANITADDIRALAGWDADAEPSNEIQFTPARVIMQDFTGVPCVVDLATMREAMAELGGDATRINPLAPAEMVIDHSVIADVFGTPEAFERNVEIEYERNRERYQFLRWGQGAFDDFKVVPPGTGIVHQVNIEHLARTVFTREVDGVDPGLPRHLRRHRLAHHDGQRHRRGRLGRRRHRGRGGDARPARVDADPARGRLQAVRRPARGRHRHRPRPHDHRDAAQARRRRQVRRVLRPRRLRAAAGQPRHHRQHEPEFGSTIAVFPIDEETAEVPRAHRPLRRAARAGRGLRQGAGPLARPRGGAPLLREARARPRHGRPVARRPQAPAGPGLARPTPRRPSAAHSPTTSAPTTPAARTQAGVRPGEGPGVPRRGRVVDESFPASDAPSHSPAATASAPPTTGTPTPRRHGGGRPSNPARSSSPTARSSSSTTARSRSRRSPRARTPRTRR